MINRRAGLLIAQTIFGLILLACWLWIVDLGEVGRILSQARWSFILLSALIGVSSSFVRAFRWRFVLRPIALVPWTDLWLISMASNLVNFLIPLRTGEISRSFLLKQRRQIPMATSLPTIAVDRSFDLMVVLILGTLGGLSGIQLIKGLSTVLLIGIVLFLVFVGFVFMAIFSGERLLILADRLLPRRLSSKHHEYIMGILKNLFMGFTVVGKRPADIALMLGLSLVSVLMDGTLYYCLFASLSVIVSLPIVLTGYALFTLTFLVPGAPGYIGSMETFGSLVFSSLGVEVDLAAGAVILYHAFQTVFLFAMGPIGFFSLNLGPSSLIRSIFKSDNSASNEGKSIVEG